MLDGGWPAFLAAGGLPSLDEPDYAPATFAPDVQWEMVATAGDVQGRSAGTLLIDARVNPTDIDVVHAGQAAQVHLTAYSSRGLPRIDGTVRTVSADRLQDPHTGQAYYLARVEVEREDLAKLKGEVELVPGMPADVLIVRRERTMVGYLLEPLLGAWRRGLREV